MPSNLEIVSKAVSALLALACLAGRAAEPAAASHLSVGIVQMALAGTLNESCERIVSGISNAAERRVRVVVFPECALQGIGNERPALVSQAVARIREAAREHHVYVLFGGSSFSATAKKEANWMQTIGPDGRELFHYDKLYDNHKTQMPGVFAIDGIPCSAMLCADRWLRGVAELPIQRGAQISFELSCNFASEWVAPLGWYWYVPRALRNNAWVVFANTGNKVSGVCDSENPAQLRHGHSAIIAPDGRITAAASNDIQTIVIADLDVSQATRAMARERAAHPALKSFWEAGAKLLQGQTVNAPELSRMSCTPAEITVAVAPITNNIVAMETLIGHARSSNADLVVFPERCTTESSLERVRAAARGSRITVVFGAEHRTSSERLNSAFVIGPDGAMLTRYDQLSATAPFQRGTNPAAMWFTVRGVPAVVTVGRDALWTELAELAAVAGAQIHIHLDNDPADDPEASLRRVQIGANLASFMTLTAIANPVGSTIWDDLRARDETHAEVRRLPRPDTGKVEVYSPFSANLVVQAKAGEPLIVVTRRVGKQNPWHPARTSNFNPQMEAWYRVGAAIVGPGRSADALIRKTQ